MIVNPYNNVLGRGKSFLEKIMPMFLERFILPWSIGIYDKFILFSSRKKAKEYLKKEEKLFTNIEIETVNRCNGKCSFCPINRNSDPRDYKKMSIEMFMSIIKQLKDLDYDGSLGLYSNNEPLLDKRLGAFLRIARTSLPNAKIYIFTNGTLLSREKVDELMKYLDKLVIDNYNDNLKLIPSVKEVYDYIQNKSYKDKIEIYLRKENEILLNRGGESNNRSKKTRTLKSSCVYLYEQMIVRPDGKVSLCCNDALGKTTMGDLNKESIEEVWYGNKYSDMRELMAGGREFHKMCSECDSIITEVYANKIFE